MRAGSFVVSPNPLCSSGPKAGNSCSPTPVFVQALSRNSGQGGCGWA